ncbi:MAG TPA: glycosyltransferase family 2 protein, partial [Gaiellaceae bacterium]|nr:glycosyltransferase family 2 protein [Gaiellaceae bacterium]
RRAQPRRGLTMRCSLLVTTYNWKEALSVVLDSVRRQTCLPDEVLVADDGSRDRTAELAEVAGATVLPLRRRGKGQALSAAERAAPPGRLLLCDADLRGDLRPLLARGADVNVAVFRRPVGGGFGLAKGVARHLIRICSGFEAVEPLSGQRALSPRARSAVFPLAPGFGCEVRMTIDAKRAGLRIEELELDLEHRATGRDASGFLHRGRQLLDVALGCGPLAVNYRGRRLPLVGWLVGVRRDPAVAAIAAIGLADDLWSGEERGFRAHLAAGRTTGVLKLVGIPLVGLLATRKLSGALLVGLSANALNQLDTRPGRALKVYLAGALATGSPLGAAVLLLPYDLREMGMLGDAGSNALGSMLGLSSVSRLTERGRWVAIGALAGLTLLGERRSLGELIERTPVLRTLDAFGRER